jgi:hypothetical protein
LAAGLSFLWISLASMRDQITSRELGDSGDAETVVERIARAAHRPDRITLARPGKRLAQASDVDVDSAIVDFSCIVPNAVE